MKAARVHRFGGPEVIVIDDIDPPAPGPGEVLVRVVNAGVGPWDILIREHRSVVHVNLPVTLGSDVSGRIEAIGPDVGDFAVGDDVYGVTNPNFTGGYAELALCSVGTLARKPRSLSFAEAGSAPVVALTAWEALFEHADARAGASVLILGAAGNVGAYAVQLARHAELRVYGVADRDDPFEDRVPQVDIVLDTVGGDVWQRAATRVRPGGVLVSVAARLDPIPGIRTIFFLVQVTTARLNRIASLFDEGHLRPQVGAVLPLDQAAEAHRLLTARGRRRGKIVLDVGGALP